MHVHVRILATFALPTLLAIFNPAAQAENIKVAFIDPFSGPAGLVGQTALEAFRVSELVYRRQKDADTNTLEFVPFDNKAVPQETLTQLKSAVDQGIRYVVQGVGPAASAALIDAINKHNQRNPGKEVILINWAANDPELGNAKCSFWQFLMDSNLDMKLEGLTSGIAADPKIKRIYLIGQNTATGQQSSKQSRNYLKRKQPSIEIVGDDLFPLGTVKDFAPYIAKIKSSNADTVLASGYGSDLALLIKAAKEADLQVNFYTMFAHSVGVPAAMGSAGAGRVKIIAYYHPNIAGFPGQPIVEAMKEASGSDFVHLGAASGVSMLHQGFKTARSTDPVMVAFALEGMRFQGLTGELEMRKSDHQMQQPLYIATWTKTNGKDVRYDQEKTGYGWKTDEKLDTYVAAQPTSCAMTRPNRPPPTP
jgi:branched-chain amino acid transport system substrate-binding protein